MAWYRCGGGGIPSSLKSDMNDVFNKKFGTTLQDYPPDDWPGTVNLMGPLPEKTVSGSIVTFPDGADAVKLKSCEVTIAPNLDGVSAVDVVHGGYNFIDASTAEYGNLNISTGNVDTTSTSWKTTDFMPLFEGDFFFTWVSSSTYFQVKWVAYDSNKTRIDGESTATWTSVYSKQFTFPTGTAFVRFCWSVVVSGNPVTREDIRLNRGTVDLGYTEYVTPTTHTANLGRTIYGGEVDVVNGTGEDVYTFDLWDGTQNYNVSDNLTNVFRFYMAHAKPLPDPTAVQCICEGYTFPRAGWSSDTVSFYSDANNFTLKLPKTEVTTLAEAKAWLAQHNVTFLYATTPTDFTFTPVPILSRLGDNTLWGDGDLSVTYRRDIDLALAQ